jgi:putative hydrolase of the HAD superfamily
VTDDKLVVWCDFGGVLTDPLDNVLGRVATRFGVPTDALLDAANAVAAEFGGDGLAPLETGRLDEAKWGRRVTERLAPTWTPRADLGRLSEIWYADRTFNQELCDALTERRDQGCRLAMLTNSVREWEPYRAVLMPDRSPFEAIVRSHEHGVRKPDPAIYRLAEETLGVVAANCVLIDDSERNCRGAERVGWRAIRYRDNAGALAELDELLAGR